RIDGEEGAGDVPIAGDLAVDGRVDAVIVARRQVEGGIGAAVEAARLQGVGQKAAHGVVEPLALDEAAALGDAALGDYAVDGRDHRAVGVVDRAQPRRQLAGEEVVE